MLHIYKKIYNNYLIYHTIFHLCMNEWGVGHAKVNIHSLKDLMEFKNASFQIKAHLNPNPM